MGVRHERGDAKIDHLVKDWLRLQSWRESVADRCVLVRCERRREH